MADPLHTLLDLQAHDLAADAFRHRRASLPERAQLVAAEAEIARIDTEAAALRSQLADIAKAQGRLEDEVASLAAKATAENTRLYSGTVTSPRELQAIQEEIDALNRRRSTLEDDVIVRMEEAEPLQAHLDALVERRAGQEGEASRLRSAIEEAERAIDAELATELAARGELAAAVPDDLLATYERVRARLGGVAIARLEGAQCGGCHLALNAVELAGLRKVADGVIVTHEECGRILVPR